MDGDDYQQPADYRSGQLLFRLDFRRPEGF